MSRFTSHLGIRMVEDAEGRPITRAGRCLWRLAAPLSYDVGVEGSGETITAPAGMFTDLASIPWPARGLLPPDGPWAKAAVIHDFLYVTGGRGVFAGRRGLARATDYSRREADAILGEAMAVLGVPAWKRAPIVAAVRVAGQRAWGR